MEFYNDQNLKIHLNGLVSIPNGMEFYKIARYMRLRKKDVSIPNGMEFYGISCSFKILFVTRFNSQRDGILRLAAGLSRTAHYVSIPNGMEFYLSVFA